MKQLDTGGGRTAGGKSAPGRRRRSEKGVRFPGRLEQWPVERLKPRDGNPRTHSPEQVAKIVRRLQEFGWTNPILVDRSGEIVAGHGRLLAALELGMTVVPVIKLGHLTDEQKRAYAIADNQLALDAGWDEDLLAAELQDLMDEDFDLELTGFDAEELEARLHLGTGGGEEGGGRGGIATGDGKGPVTRTGDLWVLGEHLLLCGDPDDTESFVRLTEAEADGEYGCRCVSPDPKVCDAILWQWARATGRAAVLEEDGRAFDEVARTRGVARGE